ncbi:MAG: B-box zinc finger protein [Terriglobia bacterium]
MDITLKWVGPYSFGHFGELSQYLHASDPHVYVRVQTFHSRKIAAVGTAANLSSRMNEYLRDFLSRQYYLGNEEQTQNDGPAGGAGRLAVFDSIDRWIGTAVEEVKGFSFFAAPCDHEMLDDVEAELLDRLWMAAESSRGRIVRDSWKNENNRQSGELNLKHQFSTPEAKGVLEFIPETSFPTSEVKRTDPVGSTVTLGPDVYTYSAPGMPMCPECGQRPAIFYCSTHQSAVCLECVARHDKREDCVYVPAYRAPKPPVAQATVSAQAKPPSGSKPQSILGI